MNDEVREKIVPTEQVIQAMSLSPGDVVADVGAGSGYYSLKFAERCSKVYAIDAGYAETDVREIEERAKQRGISNLVVLAQDVCEEPIPEDVTLAFFSNSFHDMSCREEITGRLREIKARAAVVEANPDAPFGPPRFKRMSKEELEQIFSRAGYRVLASKDFQYHYMLVLGPQRQGDDEVRPAKAEQPRGEASVKAGIARARLLPSFVKRLLAGYSRYRRWRKKTRSSRT